jgi:hypothetical protein
MTRSRLALLSLALVAAVAAPPRAHAEGDTSAELNASLTALDAAIAAKDESAANAEIKKLPGLYKGTVDKEARGKTISTLGKLLKPKTPFPGLKKIVLDTIVSTEDGAAAWKGLQPVYPNNDVEDSSRFNVDIVKAVGQLHPEGQAIDMLLETFKSAKQHDLAAEAVLALGNYHKSKRRVDILEEIAKIGEGMKPSQTKSKGPSPESQAKWSAIGGSIGKALDMLTGQSIGDPIDWFKKIRESDKNLKGLFRD